MLRQDLTKRSRSLYVAGGIVFCYLIWALVAGQDANWDLKNYHYYNGFAFVEGRHYLDIAAAQLQTYFNPALDVLIYLAIAYLPPPSFALIVAAAQGGTAYALFLLCRVALLEGKAKEPIGWAAAATLVGVFGPTSISQIGTTFYDSILAGLGIVSVLALRNSGAWARSEDWRRRPVIIAGLAIGIATALKLTFGIYALALLVTLSLTIYGTLRRRALMLILWTTSAAVGFFAASSFWLTSLWVAYRNPLFPFFNSIFKSPFADPLSYSDQRFTPKNADDFLLLPFRFTVDRHVGSELPFSDIRFGVVIVIAVVGGLLIVARSIWKRADGPCEGGQDRFQLTRFHIALLCFFALAYLIWLSGWGIYRYLALLELIAPLVIVLLMMHFFGAKERVGRLLTLLVLVSVVLMVRAPEWGRLPWGGAVFGVALPDLPNKRALFTLISTAPTAYVVPALPEESRTIRLESNFFNADTKTQLTERLRETIRGFDGDIYVLGPMAEVSKSEGTLQKYGLTGGALKGCAPILTRMDADLVVCPVSRR